MEITEERFVELLRESFDEPAQKTLPDSITRDTALEDLDGWDSMTRLSLTVGLEEECGLALEQEDFLECETVGDLIDALSGMTP